MLAKDIIDKWDISSRKPWKEVEVFVADILKEVIPDATNIKAHLSEENNSINISYISNLYFVSGNVEIKLEILSNRQAAILAIKDKLYLEKLESDQGIFGLYSEKGRNKANSEILDAIINFWEVCRKHSELGALDTDSREMICSIVENFPSENEIEEYRLKSKELKETEDVIEED